jgi:hypothetical protein
MDKKYYTAEDLAEIITYIDKREKPYTVRAARSLLAKYPIENIDKYDNSEEKPAYLKCIKPYYYSIENIYKVLTKKYKRRFSLEEIKTAYHRKKLIENDLKLAGEEEDAFHAYLEEDAFQTSYNDDPYSYENMVAPDRIRAKIRNMKLEIMLEAILNDRGLKYDEEEFIADSIAVEEVISYLEPGIPIKDIEILEKQEKINNPVKHYIKNID